MHDTAEITQVINRFADELRRFADGLQGTIRPPAKTAEPDPVDNQGRDERRARYRNELIAKLRGTRT